jgi:ribose transport system substrate-binding protein
MRCLTAGTRFFVAVLLVSVVVGPGSVSAARARNGLLSSLPPQLRVLYTHTVDVVSPSPYNHFAAVRTPWKICFADSYEGNPWRLQVRKELERLAAQFHRAGKVSQIMTAVSNNDVALQISQVRGFIDKHCSAILLTPQSPTGVNSAIKAAFNAHIPVVSFASAATSPYGISADSNYYVWGQDMARGIVRQLHGTGNVIMVKGIAGTPTAEAENQGAQPVWSKNPGIHIVGQVYGNWTPAITKSAVLQALATHPQKIDAVWTTGSELREVAEAFDQAHRPVPLITASVSGDGLGYLHQNKSAKFYGGAVLPTWNAQAGFRVAVRILEGQHPKLNVIMWPIPVASSAALNLWWRACMTPSTANIFPVAPKDPMPESLLNKYFRNGHATPPYSYAQSPKPCG